MTRLLVSALVGAVLAVPAFLMFAGGVHVGLWGVPPRWVLETITAVWVAANFAAFWRLT